MIIAQLAEKCKPYFRIILVILLSFMFLGLWELKDENVYKSPLKIVNINQTSDVGQTNEAQTVIASKNGTKYYFPWCGALSRIKQENRVTFASPALARVAGYTPAANCKGIK